MKVDEFRAVLQRALSSDIEERRTATKLVQANRYRHSELEGRAIMELLPASDEVLEDPARFEVLLKLLANAWMSKAAASQHDALLAITWRGLEHGSGLVRQAARRLFDSIRVLPGQSLDESVEYYVKLLDSIEAKLREHTPKNPPNSIEKAPPSVYKTLMLLWYDVAYIPIVQESTDVEKRFWENDILPYNEPHFDDEYDIDEYELPDWQEHIDEYVSCGDPERLRKLLKKREAQTLQDLDWALADLGLEKLREKIMYHVRFGEQHPLGCLVEEIVGLKLFASASQHEAMMLMIRHNKFARSIQAFANAYTHKSDLGTPFSMITVDAICCEEEKVRPEKIAADAFTEAITSAHGAIDMCARKIMAAMRSEQRARDAFAKKYDQFTGGNNHGAAQPDLREPLQVVHYMLDKLPFVDYRHVLRTSPKKIAAGLWYLFASQHPWLGLPGLQGEQLAQFAGWATPSSVSQAANSYRYMIAQNLQDPTILLVLRNEQDLQFAEELMRDGQL